MLFIHFLYITPIALSLSLTHVSSRKLNWSLVFVIFNNSSKPFNNQYYLMLSFFGYGQRASKSSLSANEFGYHKVWRKYFWFYFFFFSVEKMQLLMALSWSLTKNGQLPIGKGLVCVHTQFSCTLIVIVRHWKFHSNEKISLSCFIYTVRSYVCDSNPFCIEWKFVRTTHKRQT